ncbi:CtsR family transcriptional regulator [Aminiphilus circumscriptus]|uniref:CtsR family transcriptional regulator n=1 Tax=Aminiphilus circumscriptus TaxID=290732 RepID=UPI000492740D|nr:CtsR family transcriptional regulator [Aminiphilus circumscriptus]
MSSLTRDIESYIRELFEEAQEHQLSLRRKELAERFGCVPSQINYVLASRFTPERGYLVESQRGGHGYIRIMKIRFANAEERISHLDELVGNAIGEQDARRLLTSLQERGLLTPRERLLIEVALRYLDEVCRTPFDVSPYKRDVMQAELLKRMIRGLVLA